MALSVAETLDTSGCAHIGVTKRMYPKATVIKPPAMQNMLTFICKGEPPTAAGASRVDTPFVEIVCTQ